METLLIDFLRNFDLRDAQRKFLQPGFVRFEQKTHCRFSLTIETFIEEVRKKIEESSYVFNIIFDDDVEGDLYPRALNLEIEEF